MRKIGIIDFNIFTLDGVTQSDINVIHEFADAGYQVDYFNYRPFTKKQIDGFKASSPAMQNVHFHRVRELPDHLDCEAYFITREKLLSLAPYIQAHSQALVIGELHGPLDLVKDEYLKPYLPFLTCLRVATPSIKRRVAAEYGFKRVYVQNVSVRHLVDSPSHFSSSAMTEDGLINLVVRARFAYQKDVGATIKLFSYLVNTMKKTNFRLYLTGYGPEKAQLATMVTENGLAQYVTFTKTIPERHIYISTARLETLGYSICEEFAQGYPVVAYPGDDGVVKENFAEFRDCLWITKDPVIDGPRVVEFVLQTRKLADYQFNLKLIDHWHRDYVKRFEMNMQAFDQVKVDRPTDWDFKRTTRILRKQFDGGLKGMVRPIVYTLRNL
ncbi:glycosyltransferase [Lactiplantibacillus sp. WILCCON 0030]|uniref:Glycosyltransferase n=1 Tax=Lactiplantibacillus brownii TaxID=3069269 RepID=A0ABU1A510_9LACO|nr:glycosyltransferase [Lactiplantibacillus brownii]MDQ7936085.1 glycosyltransferase [Lactiplantibacillus brownii]